MKPKWILAVLASAAPLTAQTGDQRCVRAVEDMETGRCVQVSTRPLLGTLYPLNSGFFFDDFGNLRLERTILAGAGTFGFVQAGGGRLSGGNLDIINGGLLGVGTINPSADIHIVRTGGARIRIEADIDDQGEFDHAQLELRQDGGNVAARLGYQGGTNNFTIRSFNDSDMIFDLPVGGSADWEFHKGILGPFGRLNQDGDWSIDGEVFTGGADLAEYYPVEGSVEPGDVVAFRGEGLAVELARPGAEKRLAGIVSSDPGFVLGLSYTREEEDGVDPEDALTGPRTLETPEGHTLDQAILHEIAVNGRAPLALSGRVPCKVTASNGPIQPGDLLTVSAVPGRAMKATAAGPVVGSALEAHGSGEGTILVLANLGWFSPTADLERRVAELEAKLASIGR